MMKNDKVKIILRCSFMALVLISLFFIYLNVDFKCYDLRINTADVHKSKVTVDGILTGNFWKNTLYMNVDFDNPDSYRTVGLFILKNNKLNILEGNSSGGNNSFVTDSGYSVTNQVFRRIESRNQEDNIVDKMLKNKDNTYICISNSDVDDIELSDCYKLIFTKQ